ncbi:MAG: T9SS type A sorting domain-containing protein [Bacteroidota bacterium]|nr:T9SS type A sorting domain-containing protein [Bacteroidota bacterium]MDP4235155.1 T9SS type A sorting domain-containing protein [Bacteroidota bacterium]
MVQLRAQIRIDALHAAFKGIPITDSVLYIDHRQEYIGFRTYDYYSNDSGYSIVAGDTIVRIDYFTRSYLEPDGTKIPETYKQEIFFILDTARNLVRDFLLEYGFSDVSGGWFSDERIHLDSIELRYTDNYYHAYISGDELARTGFYLQAERGSILPNIAGWLTRMRECDSNDCGSVELFLSGSLPLRVEEEEYRTQITVYPNPAYDRITVSSSSSLGLVEIHDILGRIALQKQPGEFEQVVIMIISSLAPGMYSLRTRNQVQKICIQH